MRASFSATHGGTVIADIPIRTHGAMVCGVAVTAAVLALASGSGAQAVNAVATTEAAIAADDECLKASGSDGECGLSALQMRGSAVLKADQEASQGEAVSEAQQRIVQDAVYRAGRAKETSRGKKGGRVDSLNGQDQVDIMKSREEDWTLGPIVYQVFVDRFVPPNKSLEELKLIHPDPQTIHAWSDPVFPGKLNEETRYYTNELAYWGGDLKGVMTKLDYIKSFGDVLYLQPIFEAYSSHKYDTSDYYKIDPAYGTEEDFVALVNACHEKGLHLVLDGVFNHMGIRSPIFQDAFHNASSKHRDWFFIGEQYGPRGFKAWQNGNTLSELRLEERSLQKYLWDGKDSVIAHWLKKGADGFRLDVGTEIGREFLWDLTKAAHRHKFGSLVVGEVSAYPRWWTESMDGILSFWMGWVISGVVSGKMGGIFAGMQIEQLIRESSMDEVLRSWIIVSNHDLPRLSAVYPDIHQRKFAMTLQFVLPGAVCIYYGEEVGLKGAGDPYNRAPMDWNLTNIGNDIFNFTRTLADMRKYHRSLRIGDFYTLNSFSLLAFLRRTDRIDEIVIVLANPGNSTVSEQLVVPVEDLLEYTLFRDVISGAETRIRGGTIEAAVPPQTVRVFSMVNEPGPNSAQYKRIYGHWETFDSVSPMASLGNSVGDSVR